jgi:hypothetical protein
MGQSLVVIKIRGIISSPSIYKSRRDKIFIEFFFVKSLIYVIL